ncbi:MAG TPA: inorganic phosphate transporter [Bacteroidales bacterium]|nr:inorganic phosphate transporter [Bacteroidales bacterium]
MTLTLGETASSLTLVIATYLGIPVSTTHTVTGAIVGVGARKGIEEEFL